MSSEREKQFHVWDSYWNADRICSFDIPMGSPPWVALERHWAGLLSRLPVGAKILDIGSGNGAVGLALARAGQAMGRPASITAIDDATIDPQRYCPSQAAFLADIDFKPRVRMEALPFEDETFDAVTSQYAIEFGNLNQATAEAVRVLKPGGVLSILALPAQSGFVQQCEAALRQARHLLSDSVLFDEAARVLQEYHGAGGERDEVTRRNLQIFSHRVEQVAVRFGAGEFEVVSAVVNRLNDLFVQRASQDLQSQLIEIQSFRTRLAHYAARCQATTKAGVGDRRYELLKNTIKKLPFTIADTRSILATGYGMLAAQITAVRAMPTPVAPPGPPAPSPAQL